MARGIGLSALSLSLALLIGSCSSGPRTALVVVVESDLAVPGQLASVHVEANASTRDFLFTDEATRIPFSFGVEPEGGDPNRVAALTIEGRDASGTAIVTRRVSVGFVLGRTLVLRVRLDDACVGVTCDAPTTCAARECVDAMIDVRSLPELVPGRELDPVDAGAPIDDGGSLPRSCRDLPEGSATGLYTLDPDGRSGEAPFEAFCEMVASDGGWALIAKIDPASTALAYDAPAWTELGPVPALIVNDTSHGDALLPSYWHLPVSELRIVMERESVTEELTALLGGEAAPLRAAMETGGARAVAASIEDWTALVGMTPGTPTCVVSSAPMQAPSVAPIVRLRVGVTASMDASCAPVMLWVGLGADTRAQGGPCRTTAITAGGARLCNPSPEDRPAHTLLFAR